MGITVGARLKWLIHVALETESPGRGVFGGDLPDWFHRWEIHSKWALKWESHLYTLGDLVGFSSKFEGF